MPTFHSGIGGKITSGANEFAVMDWQFTTSNRKSEVTHSGSGGWAEWISGVTEGSGSANCVWDSTKVPEDFGLNPFGSTASLVLTVGNSTKTYAFSAIIDSIAVTSNARADAVTFSVNFTATGTITNPA
jgi:hypothetical protein